MFCTAAGSAGVPISMSTLEFRMKTRKERLNGITYVLLEGVNYAVRVLRFHLGPPVNGAPDGLLQHGKSH